MTSSPLLPVHIAAGIVAIVSGCAAVSFRKGSPRHARAGNVFVIAMLIMAASALYLAVIKRQPGNMLGGALTLYLVSTGWLTAKRKDGETRKYDWLVMLLPLFGGIALWLSGMQEVSHQIYEVNGVPVGMNFFMGSVLLLAAAGDIRMLLRGGLFGTQRIVRHLWRMCFGFFIATGSFFLGQASKVFPAIANSNLLFIPALLPLGLLIFWTVRVRFAKTYRTMPSVAALEASGPSA